MYEIMFTLHVLSAVCIGFYALLPFVTAALAGLQADKLAGYAGPLAKMNRIGQFVLIVTLLSGGAMVHEAPVSTAWWVIAVILLVIIGAVSGMMSKPLKQLASGSAANAQALAGKVRNLSVIVAVALLLVVLLMVNPDFLR
jgi:uncharacterized membrane protein